MPALDTVVDPAELVLVEDGGGVVGSPGVVGGGVVPGVDDGVGDGEPPGVEDGEGVVDPGVADGGGVVPLWSSEAEPRASVRGW